MKPFRREHPILVGLLLLGLLTATALAAVNVTEQVTDFETTPDGETRPGYSCEILSPTAPVTEWTYGQLPVRFKITNDMLRKRMIMYRVQISDPERSYGFFDNTAGNQWPSATVEVYPQSPVTVSANATWSTKQTGTYDVSVYLYDQSGNYLNAMCEKKDVVTVVNYSDFLSCQVRSLDGKLIAPIGTAMSNVVDHVDKETTDSMVAGITFTNTGTQAINDFHYRLQISDPALRYGFYEGNWPTGVINLGVGYDMESYTVDADWQDKTPGSYDASVYVYDAQGDWTGVSCEQRDSVNVTAPVVSDENPLNVTYDSTTGFTNFGFSEYVLSPEWVDATTEQRSADGLTISMQATNKNATASWSTEVKGDYDMDEENDVIVAEFTVKPTTTTAQLPTIRLRANAKPTWNNADLLSIIPSRLTKSWAANEEKTFKLYLDPKQFPLGGNNAIVLSMDVVSLGQNANGTIKLTKVKLYTVEKNPTSTGVVYATDFSTLTDWTLMSHYSGNARYTAVNAYKTAGAIPLSINESVTGLRGANAYAGKTLSIKEKIRAIDPSAATGTTYNVQLIVLDGSQTIMTKMVPNVSVTNSVNLRPLLVKDGQEVLQNDLFLQVSESGLISVKPPAVAKSALAVGESLTSPMGTGSYATKTLEAKLTQIIPDLTGSQSAANMRARVELYAITPIESDVRDNLAQRLENNYPNAMVLLTDTTETFQESTRVLVGVALLANGENLRTAFKTSDGRDILENDLFVRIGSNSVSLDNGGPYGAVNFTTKSTPSASSIPYGYLQKTAMSGFNAAKFYTIDAAFSKITPANCENGTKVRLRMTSEDFAFMLESVRSLGATEPKNYPAQNDSRPMRMLFVPSQAATLTSSTRFTPAIDFYAHDASACVGSGVSMEGLSMVENSVMVGA